MITELVEPENLHPELTERKSRSDLVFTTELLKAQELMS